MKQFINKIRKNEKGFSLVEVMIAVGVTGVLSVAVVQIMENMKKQERKMSQNFEIQQLQSTLQSQLANAKTCMETFQGRDPVAGEDIPSITKRAADGNITTLYSVGQSLGSKGSATGNQQSAALYRIGSMRIQGYNVVGAQTAKFIITLQTQGDVANLNKLGLGTGLKPEHVLEIPVKFQLNENSNTIKNCVHEAVGLRESVCEVQFLGVYDYNLNPQRCGGITLKRSAALPFALKTLEGGLEIGADGINSATGPSKANLDVTQSIGVGVRRSTGTGNLVFSGSMAVGDSGVVALTGPGDINLSGGLGVGISTQVADGNAQSSANTFGGTLLRVGSAAQPLTTNIESVYVADKAIVENQELGDSVGKHVATIGWVRNRIATTLARDDNDRDNIATDILNSGFNEPTSGLNIVKAAICTSSRVRMANANGTTVYVTGTWAGTSCTYHPLRHCNQAGICNNVYSNGLVQAVGNITAGNNITTTRNVIANNGYIRAGTYVSTNGYATAGTYVVGSQICATNTSLCWSTMQSRICTGTQMMLGISNGAVVCGSRSWPRYIPFCMDCTF